MITKRTQTENWPTCVWQLSNHLFRVAFKLDFLKIDKTKLCIINIETGTISEKIFNGSGKLIDHSLPIVVRKKKKYNFISMDTGKLLSEKWWSYANNFDKETRCAIVRKDKDYFIIDEYGNDISKPARHIKWAGMGLAIFHDKKDKLQYIGTPDGKYIANHIKCEISSTFQDGYSTVQRASDGLFNLINAQGEVQLDVWRKKTPYYNNSTGKIVVMNGNGEFETYSPVNNIGI